MEGPPQERLQLHRKRSQALAGQSEWQCKRVILRSACLAGTLS
jgi:hypothetical protein